ncbi:hypothetical protein ZWY2020_056505 [Hordeum vulgare]|nr:hypothetical protein ZWY2020_056505 [Hordeum vulgare]
MDPTMKDYMEKITSSMDDFHLELHNNTGAICANIANIDDMFSWRPDVECLVSDLGVVVADLQQGCVSATAASSAATIMALRLDPSIAAGGGLNGTDPSAQELPHGSVD